MAKVKCWSYNAGEPGKNWVRVFERHPGSVLSIEWFDQEDGKRRRRRQSLRHRDRALAVKHAEEIAAAFEELEPVEVRTDPKVLTLSRLFSLYLQEVTPEKSESKQEHDKRAARMFMDFFGPDAAVERIGVGGQTTTEIGRKRYAAFLKARREGKVKGFPRPVGDRTIEYDVKFMLAVLNWATVEQEDGTILLQRNPWRGFPVPEEKNPNRPPLSSEREEALLPHLPWRARLVLIVCRETGRRLSAVRRLRLSDLDLDAGTAAWAAQNDKSGRASVTPLSDRAVEALREAIKTGPPRIGDAWVFPAPADPSQPASKDYFTTAMTRAKKAAGLDHIRGLGYHGAKRSRVRDPEVRRLTVKVREELLGTADATLRRVYDDVTLDDLLRELGERAG